MCRAILAAGLVFIAAALAAVPRAAAAEVIFGGDDDGWLWGATEPGDGGRGLLIAPDGTRYVYLDRRAIVSRDAEWTCVHWLDRHVECVPFGETDCYRGINNFDIDAFVAAVLSGTPDACGARVYTWIDADRLLVLIGAE